MNGSACAGGGGVICECAACLGSGWFALQLPPPPAPPPAPAPPLLCQPSKGGERRHPAAPAATAVRLSGNRSRAKRWLLFIYSFLKGGSRTAHLGRVWNSTLPALGEFGMRRKGSPWTLSLSPKRVLKAVPCALSLGLGAPQPLWEPRKALRGPGKRGGD